MVRIPNYITLSILISCVAFVFGYDTGSIGPITSMTSFKAIVGDFSDTIHGVIVSSSIIMGALSATLAGVLADKYGRIRITVIGGCIDGIGAAIECASPSLGVFIVGRLIKGTGSGLFLSAVYVQVTEMSPAARRGILTSTPQFAIVFGIISGYFVCYGTSGIASSLSWRLPLAIVSALGFLFSALACLVPPSPRWLLARGDHEKARQVAQYLGLDQAEQDEIFSEPPQNLRAEMNETFWESLVHLMHDFRIAFSKEYRSRTIFGCSLLAFQQFSGINGVLYYAPQMFQSAGLSSTQASFLASGVSALVIFAATVPASLFADSWGRRTSSLLGGIGMTILMTIMGSCYAANQVHEDRGAGRWVVIVCIYLFAIVFSATWAVTLRIYLVEGLPMKTRSSASSLGQSSNWLADYVVALITPVILAASPCAAYFFFAGMTLVATISIAVFMIETKGASLEAIEHAYVSKRTSQDEKKENTNVSVTLRQDFSE